MSKANWQFTILVLILSFTGLFFLFEASTVQSVRLFNHPYHFVTQQAKWLALSLLLASVTYFLNLRIFQRLALVLYFLALVLLALPLIPGLGLTLNGASRWISIFNYTFQPVEIFKFFFINFYASLLAKKTKFISFIFFLIWPGLILLLQPDFGSLLILLFSAMIMYFLSGVDIKVFSTVLLGSVILALIAILLIPYRRERLLSFVKRDVDVQVEAYHSHQVLLALGAGSHFGRGIGNSQQKYAYVPEASSDSIFAIIAEEIGFVGSTVIILMFAAYFFLAEKMIKDQNLNKYQFLLFYGILAWIAAQLLFNLGAVVAILPLSGMPLPFFSQGGSALLSVFFVSAILLNISKSNSKMLR
ncbi:MAG: FtsW/RodA/SpoVE family cell cycle protein [Candidatus Pacebacteria bacterium]|jgi:cell division protein FtsW|nr:FtsW/RodA/SpoVE family cell cycle protein [Candidatus Paceibacterota bacterium]